ncbi:MAG TPA: Rnase Y domain-containing protein, partial [Acidimicrobiales bacterium]|nr:Rnase Y domain-containing protein [Acidimicrobiales bacterium]
MEAVVLIVGALAGIVLGFVVGTQYQRKQSATVLGSAEHQAKALLDDARRQAETTRREAAVEARDEALRLRQGVEADATKLRAEVEVETRTRLADVQQREERMAGREESL